MKARVISLCVFLLCIPAVCVTGMVFFKERSVSFSCISVVILMIAAYLYIYEKKSSPVRADVVYHSLSCTKSTVPSAMKSEAQTIVLLGYVK